MKHLYLWKKQQTRLCVLALLLLILVGLGIAALLDPYDCKIADNVTIGNLEVGGLSPREAGAAVANTLQELELTILLPGETITFSKDTLRLRLSVPALVWDAFQAGRWTEDREIPLAPALRYDEKGLLAALDAWAQSHDTRLTQPSYHLEGTRPELGTDVFDPDLPGQTLVLNPGAPECHLDSDAVIAKVNGLLAEGLAQRKLVLEYTPVPTVMPGTLDLEAIAREICIPAENDSLDLDSFALVHGSYGYGFPLAEAQEALAEANWNQEVTVKMERIPPEILGDEVYFRDVLGACQTKHTNDENRNTNLRLVCQALDGLVIQPGETFSYNGTVGERTEEKGYKPAGAYSGNRLVKDIGGGVCQGSTTLYNCVLLADLEVTERVCHGFTVNYVPIGLDAAVNWATKTDFAFRNNWNFPIKIRAEVSDGYMKMEILGTDEKDYYVEMKSGRSDEELRIYSNSYKYKFDKETGEQISKELEARSSYMYFS